MAMYQRVIKLEKKNMQLKTTLKANEMYVDIVD